MAQQPAPRPSYSFFLSHCPPEDHVRIQREAAKRAEARFEIRLENRLKALGFTTPAPKERWFFYARVLEPEMVAELEAKYPDRYERLMKDYEKLRLRAIAGQFDEEQAVA